MRYYQYTLKPPDGFIHPIERDLLPTVEADRTSIRHISLLSNDEGIVIYGCEGPRDGVDDFLEEHELVVNHEVFEDDEDSFYLYVRFRPGSPATELLEIADEHGLVIETPFPFRNGGLEMTVIGKNEDVQASMSSFLEVTEDSEVMLKNVGEYSPEESEVGRGLTDRQQEVVETAVEVGYYDIPRRATHEDVAEELGCTASTAGEHLRKAESKVMPRTSDS